MPRVVVKEAQHNRGWAMNSCGVVVLRRVSVFGGSNLGLCN